MHNVVFKHDLDYLNGLMSSSIRSGISLETRETIESMKSFSVALKTLDILESTLFADETSDDCELQITFLTSGNY